MIDDWCPGRISGQCPVWRKPKRERRSAAGRKPWDAVLMFKAIVLGALHNLSDEGLEHEIGDRLTFMRFLGLGLQDRTPDATTVWQYRERLAQARGGAVRQVRLVSAGAGLRSEGGQIVDASIVEVPRQRNRKCGCADQGWRGAGGMGRGFFYQAGAKRLGRPVDKEGRGELLRIQEPRFDGPPVQAGTMLPVTEASVHDSQMIGEILDPDNTAAKVWADKASARGRLRRCWRSWDTSDHEEGVTGQEADEARAAGQRDEGEGIGHASSKPRRTTWAARCCAASG